QALTIDFDWIAQLPAIELALGPIFCRVGARVSAVTICEAFDQRWPLARARFLKCGLRSAVNGVGVVAVDQDALKSVRESTVSRRLRNRRHIADRRVFHVEIVFADKYDGKFPHRGKIQRFVEGANVRRTVAEEADRDVLVALVLRAPCGAARDG